MSAGFIVPLICFAWVVGYSLLWSKLSGFEGATVNTNRGHCPEAAGSRSAAFRVSSGWLPKARSPDNFRP